MNFLSLTALVALVLQNCIAQSSNGAPPDGKRYIAAWLDTAGANGDRPLQLNQRMDFQFSAFQYSQKLPLGDTFAMPDEQVFATATNAVVYLTIYATTLEVPDADLQKLAQQCQRINKNGNRVLLRFLPEMNGNWFSEYGMQPIGYKALWSRAYAAVKALAKDTYFVWSPNFCIGYPYNPVQKGAKTKVMADTPSIIDGPNFDALDTNGDGLVDEKDDCALPFFPDPSQVDWVGTSIYNYPSNKDIYPFDFDVVPFAGAFEAAVMQSTIYDRFALQYNKPMMISETGAAHHQAGLADPADASAPVPAELDVKRGWWTQFLTNKTFLETYPQIKLFCLFEFKKIEGKLRTGQEDERDFRITTNELVRNAFKKDFASVKDYFVEGSVDNSADDIGASLASSTILYLTFATIYFILLGQ